jgi:outer membrane protein TolC
MARRLLLALVLLSASGCGLTIADIGRSIILPEERSIALRDPAQHAPVRIPPSVPPRTVSDPQSKSGDWRLSLDEAIRIALENARVIRVLAGTAATASGQTIYDAAITNTTIDQAQARFDPILTQNNTWSRTNTPTAELNPFDPTQSFITSTPTDAYLSSLGLTKTNVLGGQWAVTWTENPMRFTGLGLGVSSLLPTSGFPLNPQDTSTVAVSYTQPLLQGAGFRFNVAPIVIARLNTEQSFFQYKDSVQQLVLGVIEAYWNLVQARVNVWARKIQEQQSKEAYDRESARLKTGFTDISTVSQTRVTYNQFRANRIAAEADVFTRERTLRNLLYLPPNDGRQIIPTSVPASQRLPHDWDDLVNLAEQRRPDIVELKIIVEADQQRLLQAENQTLPQLNATAMYQWNGLSGTMPNGESLSTEPGQYGNWTVGLNFSVPLGLRQGRAQVRQQKLLIVRDRANVEQQVHLAIHQLASSVGDLDSAYEQYLAFKETRIAADINLRVQNEKFRTGQTIYLNVLQALNDWGTAVSSEAQQLLAYNIALAMLEQETGTILETHGLVFAEERFRAAGPLLCRDRSYPFAQPPVGAPQLYPGTDAPSENSFDLRSPALRDEKPVTEELPRPQPVRPAR